MPVVVQPGDSVQASLAVQVVVVMVMGAVGYICSLEELGMSLQQHQARAMPAAMDQ